MALTTGAAAPAAIGEAEKLLPHQDNVLLDLVPGQPPLLLHKLTHERMCL